MKDYNIKSTKREHIKNLINKALEILEATGIPFEKKTPKGLQSMAMVFLAVAGVTKSWKEAEGQKMADT